VLPIDRAVLQQAEAMVLARPRLPARAALHVAVMRIHGVTKILSFDRSFCRVPGITWLCD
jgi:predicted nucleic acid-binding protein